MLSRIYAKIKSSRIISVLQYLYLALEVSQVVFVFESVYCYVDISHLFWFGLAYLWIYLVINDISVIYVKAHRCAGGLNKKSVRLPTP